jgi:hypothetical protein
MRFYDPESNPPESLDSKELFPKVSDEIAAQRCLRLGYLPSVTTILGVIRQEWLERWKMAQAIKNFQNHGNTWLAIDENYNRDSKESIFGTEVHACVNSFLTGDFKDKNTQQAHHALPLMEWLSANMRELLITEGTLFDKELGCAGTVDLVFIDKEGRETIGDIKVVKMRSDKKSSPPLSYKCQLSAYSKMLGKEDYKKYRRISLYLASPFGEVREPTLKVFEYNQDYLKEFESCLCLWHAQFGIDTENLEDSNTHNNKKEATWSHR